MEQGGQISLYNLLKNLDREKYNPYLVCPSNGSLSKHFGKIGCKIILYGFPRISFVNIPTIILCFIKTLLLLKQNKIDIIHSDHPTDTLYLAICGRILKIPLIWHTRVSYSSRLDLINLKLASRVIGVSNAVGKRFIHDNKTPKNYLTIYNGVNCTLFKPNQPSTIREELNIGVNVPVIASIGRITREKGIDILISAFKGLNDKFPLSRLLLVGEGPLKYKREIEELISRLNLEDKVLFIGFRSDIINCISGIDILVLASRKKGEGLPRIIIEAMACGKTVVATDVDGSNETVEHDISGILVTPEDPLKMANALIELITNPRKLDSIGLEARKRVLRLFDINDNIRRIQMAYEKL